MLKAVKNIETTAINKFNLKSCATTKHVFQTSCQ